MSSSDFELKGVKVAENTPLTSNSSIAEDKVDIVPTEFGDVFVHIQGKPSNPPIITCHDVGMNHGFCFEIFLNHPKTKWMLESFCFYHIDAPGYQAGAPEIENYPSLENISLQIKSVVEHYQFKSVICFGVGAGANVLSRYVTYSEKVTAFIAISCSPLQATWSEWMQIQTLRASTTVFGMTSGLQDFFIGQYFSQKTIQNNLDLITTYREETKKLNLNNVWKYMEKNYQREDITQRLTSINCSTMLFTGSESPILDDVWEMSASIPAKNCSRLKIEGFGSMVHIESPDQLAQPLALFFQGIGYYNHNVVPLELKPDVDS